MYLRGTLNRKWQAQTQGKKPSLSGKIYQLERRLNRQKPELQYFIKPNTNNIQPSLVGVNVEDYAITREQIDSATFRDTVLGDKWTLRHLHFRFIAENFVPKVRVIVYLPRRAGSTSATGTSNFTSPLDPVVFDILYDQVWTQSSAGTDITGTVNVRMNRQVYYNSEQNIIDRNSLRVRLIWEQDNNSAPRISHAYRLTFQNK